MHKDKDGNIIGVGETTAISIITDIFKDSTKIIPQFPIIKLLTEDYIDSLSESYLKHKIDIVIFTPTQTIAVRVQGKDHEGVLKSARDTVQKKILEWHNCIVVDLNWYDCPNLFKEKLNDGSIQEVKNALSSSDINL